MNGRITTSAFGLVAGLMLTACYDGGVVCTAEAVSSFAMEIRDSLSGEGLAGRSVASVVDGSFADTLDLNFGDPDSIHVSGVFERAGTYDVTVTSPGYLTWSLQDVVVEQGACHVHPVHLVARLQLE